MKYGTLVLSALVGLTGTPSWADNFVTITPTGSTSATVAYRWAIGSDLSGLGFIDGNSGFPGATATNFFTIKGAAIPALGNPTGFTSYLPTGAATPQGSVGNALTPDTYSGLTYAAENLGLIGPLSFYAIHHRITGDYLALIQPSVPTVSDQKPMSVPGGPLTSGATGYFALSYAADDAGGWGANLFYYLRTNGLGETVFGSLIPALLSGPTDRWNLGAGRGFTDLAYTSTNVGFGFGPSQFYYLRLDPLTQTTFFGRLNPLTGVATDIQDLGGVYRTLVFTPTNVGYGANLFYSIGRGGQTITFAPIANRTACDVPFTFVYPVASSGLAVTLAVSGPATVLGNIVTLTGTGTVVLTASQAGDANFAAAPSVAQSFAVGACETTPQTISFAPVPDRGLCEGAFTVSPTASSGLPVTLTVTSGPATVSGNTVTFTGPGSVTLQATQAGNATYAAATPVSQTFTAAKWEATIVLDHLTKVFYGTPAFPAVPSCLPVATTTPAGLPVTITYNGSTTYPTAVGSYAIVATINSDCYTGSVTGTYTLTPDVRVAQTVSFGATPITDHVFGDAPFTLSPTASSGMPTTLSVISGPATVSGNTVTMTGAGTVVLEVSQSGHIETFLYASRTQSFAVAKATAPIALGNLVQNYDGSPKSVVAVTTPAGLPVSLTYDGGPTPPSAAGSHAVHATINHPDYQGSAAATLAIAPLPAIASVTYPPPGIYVVGQSFSYGVTYALPVIVTGTPRLELDFQMAVVGSPGPSLLRHANYTSGSGSTTLLFTYMVVAGDNDDNGIHARGLIDLNGGTIRDAAGRDASLSFTTQLVSEPVVNTTVAVVPPVTLPPPATVMFDQTITIAPISGATVNVPFALTASSSVGLMPITFAVVSGDATLSGAMLTPKSPGPITLRASQAGSGVIRPASTDATFSVRAAETITFNSPVSAIMIYTPVQLSARSLSGLPVTYTLVSGQATLAGNTLTPTGPGPIVVRASSAGSDSVAAASTTVDFGSPQKAAQWMALDLADVTVTSAPISLAATSSAGLPIAYSVDGPARISGHVLTLTGAAGPVTVRALQPGNELYNPAPELVSRFTVRAIGQQVYLGTMGSDTFAVIISADNSHGTFLTRLAATGEAILANFQLNADGTFRAGGTSSFAGSAPRDVSGTVMNGAVTGLVAAPGGQFAATIAAPAGSTGSLAGVYRARVPGSASGDVYIVVGPAGDAFAVAVTPFGVSSGTGTVSTDGVVNITTSSGSIVGNVNPTTGTIVGTVRNGPSTTAFAGLSDSTEATDRLVNLSSRLRVVDGDASRSVIAGFVVSGNVGRQVLVRAVGPGLSGFGVQTPLRNPRLQLYRGSTLVAENDDWSDNREVSATGDNVGAFRLGAGSRDSALVTTLAAGAYTVIVTGVSDSGTVLIEVYDADASAPSAARQLVNISTRGFVETEEGSLIAGFVVTGNAPKRVLIRGIGPSLAQFGVSGVLADPEVRLYSGGTLVTANDNWETGNNATQLAEAFGLSGAFALPAGSKDAALVVVLAPGAYTVQLNGVNRTTGAALVEVYDLR